MAATVFQENRGRPNLSPISIPEKGRCVDIVSLSLKGMQSKDMDEFDIKVRKPYTISKQREKWTEEEHEKFLEALKLYGRAWRQIQEHIGTKTAVQIRSHAQKFFSKVDHKPGSKKAIEIPPPRPKRKALHPYPRKYANPFGKGIPVTEQLQLPSLPTSSFSEQDSGSPVSVLSAVGSDAFASSLPNQPNICTSPMSSDGRDLIVTSVGEKDNRCHSSTTSNDDENISSLPPSTSTRIIMQDKFEELDCAAKQQILSAKTSQLDAQATSLKLFGKTVVISNPTNICSSTVSTPSAAADSGIPQFSQEMDLRCPTQATLQLQALADRVSSAGAMQSTWVPWQVGSPLTFDGLPSQPSNSVEATITPFPWWWVFNGNLPSFINSQCISSGIYSSHTDMDASDEYDATKDGSSTGSNSDSKGKEAATNDKYCDVVNSHSTVHQEQSVPPSTLKRSKNSAFVSVKANLGRQARGFVPYKRCTTEKQQQS
ncbi:uncharacterized protein [Typha angustifolia]|uniref:uncharacterized protein n=1 Tax=Typha angustifolia TaxID=59011 RepID=UPI003C2D8A5E